MQQGHSTGKLSEKPLRDISRLLVMCKVCPERCFHLLEEFDLFGYRAVARKENMTEAMSVVKLSSEVF